MSGKEGPRQTIMAVRAALEHDRRVRPNRFPHPDPLVETAQPRPPRPLAGEGRGEGPKAAGEGVYSVAAQRSR